MMKEGNLAAFFLREDGAGRIEGVSQAGHYEGRSARAIFQRVFALSDFLLQREIPARGPILMLTGTRAESAEILLAAFNTGTLVVPMSVLSGTAQLCALVHSLRPACVFHDSPLAPSLLAALRASQTLRIALPSPFAGDPCALSYDETAARQVASVFPAQAAERPALLIHTSGSEGQPKAIRFSQASLRQYFLHHDRVYAEYFDAENPNQSLISVFPFHHLAGITTCLQALLMGRRVYLLPHFEPGLYLDTVARGRLHFIPLVSSLYAPLLKAYARMPRLDLSSLRLCVALGEPCAEGLRLAVEEALGVPLVSAYGLTECLPGLSHERASLAARAVPPGSCGRQLFGELKLVDEAGREGNRGLLHIRNPTVSPCYVDEALNRRHLVDGWFVTRDLFRRDAAGFYYHEGRSDDLFIVKGKNIFPSEVEDVLSEHPAVSQACALALPSMAEGLRLAAAVSLQAPATLAEIHDFLRGRAPSHLIPSHLLIVDTLPMTGPGKIDRAALRALFSAPADPPSSTHTSGRRRP